jgi:hypothetical protein
MARMGQQYGGDRDLWQALGYKEELTYEDYAAKYERNEMAKAVINRPVEATWRGEFGVQESSEDNETALEKDWDALTDQIKIKQAFVRLDKLASLGNYGVLLLGLDDVKKKEDSNKPVDKGARKLLYVKPFSEGSADILSYETNPSNPRYGLPLTYQLTLSEPGGNTTTTMIVHYTRIIHVTGELLESEYEGTPELEVIFNRLDDLEKLVGGSAEMFWRGARPGYQGKVDPEYQMTATAEQDLKDQIDEYEHNLRRILVNTGISLDELAAQVSDPANHVDVQIQMISAVTGIPKRILVGSERGELASSQDVDAWLSLIKSRREEYAEIQIVRPFVDKCIEYKILSPAKEKYVVVWEDLFAQSEKDKAEIGKTRSLSLQAYSASPTAESIVPSDAFYRFFLGLDEDAIELIQEMKDAAVEEEEAALKAAAAEEAALNQPEPPEPTVPAPGTKPPTKRGKVPKED